MKIFNHRIVCLSLACLAVSVIAGSPLAGLGLVVAQVITPVVAALGIGLTMVALFLLDGRDETFIKALVASRAFILAAWFFCFTLLWLITLAVTSEAYESAAASSNAALAIGMLAYRRWKAGSFWPSRSDEAFDKLSASLDEVIAELRVLFPKAEARVS